MFSFSWDDLAKMTISGMVTGAATTIGVWFATRHILGRVDKQNNGQKKGGKDNGTRV